MTDRYLLLDVGDWGSVMHYFNQILAALPDREISQLRPNLTRVRLVTGQILHAANEPINHVFFMEHGFTSMVVEADGAEDVVETGLIGPEGMVGLAVLFSERRVSYGRAMIQGAGVGYRMSAADLSDGLAELPSLERLLLRAVEFSLAHAAQTAACNGRHQLKERLARWLLMAHDRIGGDELLLTQDLLSIMLAVRRSGVTLAMQGLEEAGVIIHRRGRIRICDRAGLEASACACYGRLIRFAAKQRLGERSVLQAEAV